MSSLVCSVVSEKILFVPVQQTSHTKLQLSIVDELQRRGHSVYTLLGDRFGRKLLERNVIASNSDVLWFKQDVERKHTGANVDDLLGELLQDFNIAKQMETFGIALKTMTADCDDMLTDQMLRKRIQEIGFDYAVIDYWHAMPCLLLLPSNLSIPYMTSTVGVPPWVMREPALPSFVPWVLSLKSEKMSFWERLHCLLEYALYYNLDTEGRRNHAQLQRYAPDGTEWNDLIRKSLLFIHFRDHLTEWPQPTMPNNIRVFGLTYDEVKPLDGPVKDAISNSVGDVTLVSFGSMGGKLPLMYVQKLFEAFKVISGVTFIFSYGGDITRFDFKIPKNVKIFKWLPQNDILGHTKTKLFITHSGHNGQSEALYHGVPMVCMPLLFEQFHNALRVERHEYGVSVNIYDFAPEQLVEAIRRVLSSETIKKNVARVSSIVKSQPHGRETAARWIEHVMKFGGEHLRSAALDMPLYQFLMLDLMIFCLFCFLMLFCVTCFIAKRMYSCFRKKNAKLKSN